MWQLIVTACICLVLWTNCEGNTFELEGSTTSFAKYTKWNPCTNGSLKFEFKTEQLNGMLMYLDDGGKLDFFEAKVVGGSVRLRVNFGEGIATVLTLGENLHDNRWHSVLIRRDGQEVTMEVDQQQQSKKLRAGNLQLGKMETNSYLFIGGLPAQYMARLSELALPSVVFEPRFRGSIRNLMYSNCSQPFGRPLLLDSQGVRTNNRDPCAKYDPCLNGGICVSTDKGAICDCSQINFEGDHCDKETIPSEATFSGQEYLSYDLSNRGDPIVSKNDEVSFFFKTRQTNGILFYTGDGSDFLLVALVDGVIMVSVNLGAGEFQHPVLTEKYNDNQWHHVVVERRSREIAILVDGLLQQTGATTGVFSMLSSNVLYVGGSANTFKLTQGKVNSNFRGCLKKVTYKADSISLDITELARTKHDLINIKGDVLFDKCENLVHSTPVTFATPESMVKVPYALAQKSGVITFQFQTNERNGLLMYSGSVQGSSDFFGLELLEGYLYLVLDLGSGAIKIQASTLMVTDGLPHKVMVTYNGKQGKVSVDGVEVEYTTKGNSEQLDLDGTLYIGAAAEGSQLPREMWVGSLGYGYVGCMQDVFIDGKVKDLSKFAEEQEIHGMTQECHPTRHQCTARPCLHDGICTEGWNRFLCDCSATGYFGPSCNEAATTLSFNGEQYVKISLPQESRAEAEDISLRFKTRRQGGLLFATLSQKTSDKMVLTLEGGRARLDVNLGSGSTTLYVGSGLSDDQWHTVHIRRRLTNIQLRVDRDIVENGKLVGAATLLRVNNLYLGSYTSGTEDGSKILDIDAIAAGGMQSDEESRHSNFAGQMQQFIFNKKPYFELAQTEAMSSFIEVTADFADTGPDATCSPNSCDNRGRCVQNWDTYVCNCDMTSFSGARCNEESIAYRFGDSRPGLIMFTYPVSERPDTQTDHLAVGFSTTTNQERTTLLQVISGNSNDFVELELVNGIIFALYNMGTIPHPIGDTFTKVNDGKYHIVRFTRAGANSTIQVDDEPIQTKHPPGAQLGVFNNQAQIYVGGKMGRDGSIEAPFKGTMAGLVFNGKRVLDLAESNDAKITILGDVEKTNITSLLPVKITQATSQPAISTPPYSKSKNVQSTSPMKATNTGSIETTTAVPDTTTVKKPLTTKQVITTKRMTTITSIEQTTPYGSHTTDDIVFTGSGCSSDDEDCTNGSGSTDDIVIPTVEVSTPPILEVVTSRKPQSTTTPLPVTTSDCKEDEEDCGSGSGEGTTPDIFLPVPEVTPETTSPTEKTHQPETSSAGIQSTKSTTANPVVDTSLDGLTKTVIYETSRTVPVSTKTPPEGENTGQTLGGGGIHLGGMNIAVIIGIIVGVLVALLILIFIIYKVKKRSNGSYKIDESKNYADVKQPLQANGDKTHHVNGSSPAKTKKGDVKEWYV